MGLEKRKKRSVVKNQDYVACSSLLVGYDALLQYGTQFWANRRSEAEMDWEKLICRLKKAFETTRPYLHIFAESYVFFLVKNGQQGKAEDFINRYFEKNALFIR